MRPEDEKRPENGLLDVGKRLKTTFFREISGKITDNDARVEYLALFSASLGYLHINLAQLLRTWWPLILIALGIGFFFTPGSGRKR